MFFPYTDGKSNTEVITDAFGGLNLSELTRDGELSDMKNITSDKFPCIAPSVKKDRVQINTNIKNIQAFISHGDDEETTSGFTGVADGRFYYQDKVIPFEYSFMSIPENTKVELVNFADRIIIAPMMYSYEYKNPDKDERVYPLIPGAYSRHIKVKSSEDPELPVSFTIVGSVTWEELGFKVGDSIGMHTDNEDFSNLNVYIPKNRYDKPDTRTPVRAVVEGIYGTKLEAAFYNKNGKRIAILDSDITIINDELEGLRVYKAYPEFSNICVYANRLWATTAFGDAIYASAPGKPEEFMEFSGLSTDSWFGEVDAKGKFTGISAFKNGVVAFKENKLYHIFGDRPASFNIAKQFSNCGCVDASSICETDAALYFTGRDGVYEYSGTSPVNISEKLVLKNIRSASAFSDGRKYYVSFDDSEKMLAYDIDKGLWHIEAELCIIGGFVLKNDVFLVTKNALYLMSDVYENEWSATLCDIYEGDFKHKGLNNIFIRAALGENSEIKVSVSVNGEEAIVYGEAKERGEYTFRVPVRFKKGDKYSIKISGNGSSLIKAIQRCFYMGGKAFTRKG